MGNANSGSGGVHSSSSSVRDRHKSGDSLPPNSPGVTKDGLAFPFDKRNSLGPSTHNKIVLQNSNDDDEPNYTKSGGPPSSPSPNPEDYPTSGRQRALTLSEGIKMGDGSQTSNAKILPTVFKWSGGGKEVYMSGTFSDWKTIPMVKSHENFVTIVDLPEGEHQYKFYIDGEWKHNPQDPSVENEMGTRNNIVKVKKTDFEVFDALDMDSISTKQTNMNKTMSSSNAGSPPGSEWGQEVPTHKPWEKASGPPILPPHLLQVILNKDTPLSCEPTLLPEPNHVMLNHLYALSIKDGVMVLSATHRYRRKYVTSLLYKPI